MARKTNIELEAENAALKIEIESLQGLSKLNRELELENSSLRDYTAMANSESQRMSLELHRNQNKLQAIMTSSTNLIITFQGILDLSKENLESALSEEAYYNKINGGKRNE